MQGTRTVRKASYQPTFVTKSESYTMKAELMKVSYSNILALVNLVIIWSIKKKAKEKE